MARRRFRRYRKRIARYAANLQEIPTTTVLTTVGETFWQSFVLAFNPTQLNTSVSQTFTVKNIEVSFYIDLDTVSNNPSQYLEDITAYIMFVPQGMQIHPGYNLDHPEYIMAYKFLGSPSSGGDQQYQPVKVRTRLARKLQSGDNIILFIKGNNVGTAATHNYSFRIHGLVRWWTKAN